ncbi:class I SAM-dependent methyltransferase [Olleya sp. R77988]|uniref:class I SAM-dependent methyltransferase n=1 Tax=Olleya sp. R77988 TaxID=3093875 RepID=UPI0037C5AD53
MDNKIKNNIALKVKDHSVSGEEFQLVKNKTYGFLETIPKPSLEDLPEYYKTEDYISHTDSKRNLFEKAYHSIRQISLKKKLKLINSFNILENQQDKSEQKTLLDFGCGTGDFLKTAQSNNWNVSGIEPNEDARKIANQKTSNTVFGSDHLMSFTKHSFDVITLWHVLEHVPNLEEQIKQLKNLLKQDGILIVAVPNYKSYDATYYKQFWAAYDVPRHLWHFNQTSVSKLFSSIKMKVIKTKPMVFDSYYVSLLSEKYKSGKMKIFNASWTGFKSNLKAKSSGEYSSLIYIIKNS